jgi:hypothetical protein
MAMILKVKPWPFPNRYFFLQLIHNPLTCPEAFAAMRTRYSQKKGWFSDCDRTNAVV